MILKTLGKFLGAVQFCPVVLVLIFMGVSGCGPALPLSGSVGESSRQSEPLDGDLEGGGQEFGQGPAVNRRQKSDSIAALGFRAIVKGQQGQGGVSQIQSRSSVDSCVDGRFIVDGNVLTYKRPITVQSNSGQYLVLMWPAEFNGSRIVNSEVSHAVFGESELDVSSALNSAMNRSSSHIFHANYHSKDHSWYFPFHSFLNSSLELVKPSDTQVVRLNLLLGDSKSYQFEFRFKINNK